jgi:hypothetical protein
VNQNQNSKAAKGVNIKNFAKSQSSLKEDAQMEFTVIMIIDQIYYL